MKTFVARTLAGVGILAGTAGVASAALSDLKINEAMIPGTGTDDREFVELYDGGTLTSLAGLEIRLYNGTDGLLYRTAVLSGTMPADGYYVVGSALVTNVDQTTWSPVATTNIIQNGDPDTIVLYDTVGAAVVDAVQYYTQYDTAPGTAENASAPAFGREGNPAGVGGDDAHSRFTGTAATAGINMPIGRFPDGEDSGDNETDFVMMYGLGTPGASNSTPYSSTAIESCSTSGLTTTWIIGFTNPIFETALSGTSLPANIPNSYDSVTPNQFISVKDPTGGGDQMLMANVLAEDYDVWGNFYIGTYITPESPTASEYGGLIARSSGADHQNNTTTGFAVASPVGTYGGSSYKLEIDYGTGIVSAVKNLRAVRTVVGSTAALAPGWHVLAIRCNGGNVDFFVNNLVTPMASLTGEIVREGYVGVGYRETMTTTGTVRCNFDNLHVGAVSSLPVSLDSYGVE